MRPLRGAPALLLLLTISCGKSVDRQVQEAVRKFDGAGLSRKDVEIVEIKESGKQALAIVKVQTALKLVHREDGWVIDEIRLADGRWERAQHILDVLNEKRAETTAALLAELEEGIGRYRKAQGTVPRVGSFEELVDILTPAFVSRVIRLDGWSRPFAYQAESQQSYDLRSAGPDGTLNTADDLTTRSP